MKSIFLVRKDHSLAAKTRTTNLVVTVLRAPWNKCLLQVQVSGAPKQSSGDLGATGKCSGETDSEVVMAAITEEWFRTISVRHCKCYNAS